MGISFQDSKQKLAQQTPAVMSARTMLLSNDASATNEIVEEVFEVNRNYKWYENSYIDDKMSRVDSNKNIIVNDQQQSVTQENNSQCIPFELDRYYDGVDLNNMTFNIHYINAKEKEGVSIPINFKYSDTKIRFGWLLDNGVTYLDGDVQFEIVASGVNEKNENYIWRTKPNGKINILKALAGDSTVKPTMTWYTQFINVVDEKIGEASQQAQDAKDAANRAESSALQANTIAKTLREENSAHIESEISKQLGSYYTKTAIDQMFEDFDISDQLVETNKAITDVDAKLVDYDLSTEVDAKIASAKQEVTTDAANTYYTKTAVDQMFEEFDISDQLEGINSQIGTLSARFNEYDTSTEVDSKIGTALEGYYTKDEVNTKFEEFDISDQLDDVNAEINLVKSDVETNARNIATLSNDVSQAKSDVETLNTAVTNANLAIQSMQSEIDGFESNVYEVTYDTRDGVDNTFILWENGEVKNQFVIQGGGGGGTTAATTLTVERITQSPLTITPTDKAIIEFNCTSVDSDNQTVDCSYTWKRGSTVIKSGSLVQGHNSFDLTEFVSVGTQKFTLTVSDEGGSVNVKTWTVQVVDLRLVSTFNDQLTYEAGKPVSFTYTPYGAIEKTVHFKLDGEELPAVVTTASGLLQSYTLPAQAHGAHLLECYITATINGVDVETDHIYRDIIWYDEESTVPVIGCIYRYDHYGKVPVKQYSATSIVYTVYDPNSITPTISRSVDGESIGTQVLETNTDIWSYKSAEIGDRTLVISCGDTSVTIVMDVKELGIKIEPVTANMAFDFNPVGYSNTGSDRMWSDKTNTEVKLAVSDNFDWTNGGYQLDENGDQYFCVKAGTTATISYNLFADDAKKNGKEFKCIFKTTNVKKRDSSFLSCIDNNIGIDMMVENVNISSNNSSLYVPYCEDDIIEFEFNISKDTDIPMVMTYEDGVANRPMIYSSDASFMQSVAQPITIGSPDCDVHIYRMKAYYASLTDSDILANFIADARTAEEIIDRYNRNQIYDENSALTPEVLAEKCTDLRIIMIDAPWFTNDKDDKVKNTTVRQIYKGGDAVLDNWVCTGAQHSGQGTSSNKYGYAGRNLRLIMNKDESLFTLGDGKTTSKTVTLTRDSVPTNFFNIKVNIASSENQNNAQFARRYNEFNPVVRPAKVLDPRVKDTMEFFNCVVFIRENNEDLTKHREFNDTNWHFYAIGNIGDDKKTDHSRVNDATDPRECVVEIMDFDVPLAEFPTGVGGRYIAPEQFVAGNTAYDNLYADYTYDEEGKFKGFGAGSYEFRYEMDKITDEQRQVNIDAWRDFYKFVVTSTDEEFVANFENYFITDSALYFYLFTERYLMVDNRAKNSFWHLGKVYITDEEATTLGDKAKAYTIDNTKASINNGYRWDLCFGYDFDTSIGISNVGELVMTYGQEDVDKDASGAYIYRAAESNFFCKIRDLFSNQLKGMFQSRESLGAWSSTDLINKWDNAQTQFPEELWRLDIQRKYLRTYQGVSIDNSIVPAEGAKNPMFLEPMLNGRKRYQRRQFERNQELYMATKYISTFAKDDFIRFRFNNPTNPVVKQDYTMYLTPYSDMYLSVAFGNTDPVSFRAKAGVEYTIQRDTASATADIILVYGASFIQGIGDLSKCYVGDNDLTKASRLQSLVIGSSIAGYTNPFMSSLALGNNKLLEYLDIRNITGLNSVVDISNCGNLVELRAEGSGATGVIFANGGKIETAHIPAVISLTAKNLNYLKNFTMEGYNNIQTLIVENSPIINTYNIVNSANVLNTVRLIGIDWNESYNIEDTAVLDRMYVMRGIDSAGYTTTESVVTGDFHAAVVRDRRKSEYKELWPELNITENTLVNQFIVTFKNEDGTVLDVQYVDKGESPVDPIARAENPIAIPTKESSVSTNYTYAGWDRALIDAFENYTVTATYSESIRSYKVKYVSKGSVLQEEIAPYGSTVIYSGEIPTYTLEEGAYKYYLFDGWDAGGYVTGDKTINAVFDSCEYKAGYFNGKDLSDMRPVEVYMMMKLSQANVISIASHVRPKDKLNISLGNDVSYNDIEEQVLISEKTEFTGSNYVDTGINLLSEDRDFVVAIDCKVNSGSSNSVIAQCYSGLDSSGFRLTYNNGVKLGWGGTNTTPMNVGERQMIVLRHIKGELGLHVYVSDTTDTDISYVELNGAHAMNHNVSLVFGCNKLEDGSYENNGKGTVYWSKVWYADLGDEVCRKIACWPHEDIALEACFEVNGTLKRYYLSDGSGMRSSMAFIASRVLDEPMQIHNKTSNVGGWAAYNLNAYLNNRIYGAMSDTWKQLIKQVTVKSSNGGGSTELVNASCYVFIPSLGELTVQNSEPFVSEGTLISHMSSVDSRVCHDSDGVAREYWTRSPSMLSTNLSAYVYRIDTSGTPQQVSQMNVERYVRIMLCM